MIGDFNAIIQTKQGDAETPTGPLTFDKTNIRLASQTERAIDNRARYLTYCMNHNLKVVNNLFQKPDKQLLSYEEPGTRGPPYTRGRYEILENTMTTEM